MIDESYKHLEVFDAKDNIIFKVDLRGIDFVISRLIKHSDELYTVEIHKNYQDTGGTK